MINRTLAFGIQFPKHMRANDIYPFSTLNRYVGYTPHTFPTWKLTYRHETHRTQHAKDPNIFRSVELCDLQCAIRDIFLEEKKTSRTMKILSLKQCRECHLLRMQRTISRKFNSYNARGAFFLKPCFYSDASGQRSTEPYYISYKSNFVQNPIIAFVNRPLANTKNLPFCPQFYGQWFYIEYDMDVTDCTKTVPHATKIDVKECAALNNKRTIISPSCCSPSCASPWIRQRMPYWRTRGKLALCTRDLKPIDQLPYWKPETGNPS